MTEVLESEGEKNARELHWIITSQHRIEKKNMSFADISRCADPVQSSARIFFSLRSFLTTFSKENIETMRRYVPKHLD